MLAEVVFLNGTTSLLAQIVAVDTLSRENSANGTEAIRAVNFVVMLDTHFG